MTSIVGPITQGQRYIVILTDPISNEQADYIRQQMEAKTGANFVVVSTRSR